MSSRSKKKKAPSHQSRLLLTIQFYFKNIVSYLKKNWVGLVVILSLTVIFFGPVLIRASSYSEGGDAMFNAWTLSRNHHCILQQGCPNYSDGNIYMRDCEFPGTAILDFTHIAAKSWFQLRLDNLLKLGVDFFEGDFRYGLFEFGDIDIKFYNGMLPEDVNNGYAKIFNETIYDATSRAKGLNNAMLISNCASAGSQAYPLQTCSVLLSTYSSLAASIRNALSFGMSGFSCCTIAAVSYTHLTLPTIYTV